jgi:deoxycytidylate deaminase
MIIFTQTQEKIHRIFYEPNKFSIHAEKDAIKNVKDPREMCNILIVKIVNNQLVQAYPCEMCKKLLLKKGFEKMLNYAAL